MQIDFERPWKMIECPECWSRLQVHAEDVQKETHIDAVSGKHIIKYIRCPVCEEKIIEPSQYFIKKG